MKHIITFHRSDKCKRDVIFSGSRDDCVDKLFQISGAYEEFKVDDDSLYVKHGNIIKFFTIIRDARG